VPLLAPARRALGIFAPRHSGPLAPRAHRTLGPAPPHSAPDARACTAHSAPDARARAAPGSRTLGPLGLAEYDPWVMLAAAARPQRLIHYLPVMQDPESAPIAVVAARNITSYS
jgi:hypothetical protein